MLFKKDFIRDNGKIRNCDKNIAKMNVLEYTIFFLFIQKGYKQIYEAPLYHFWECLKNLFLFITDIILITFLPITLIIKAIITINKAKKECEMKKQIIV